MRTLIQIALLGACATVCACSDADQGPNPFAPQLAVPAASQLRIVSPADGAVMGAAAFTVEAEQQVHGGPLQGRAQLQVSADGSAWSAVGAETAWSAQDAAFALPAVQLAGAGPAQLRLVVYEVSPADPFLISNVTRLHCLGQSETQLADAAR